MPCVCVCVIGQASPNQGAGVNRVERETQRREKQRKILHRFQQQLGCVTLPLYMEHTHYNRTHDLSLVHNNVPYSVILL